MKTRLIGSVGFSVLALTGCVLVTLVAQAQDFPVEKPGEEHKLLKKLTGTFDARVKFWVDPTKEQAVESVGTMTRKGILEGRYVQEMYKGEVFGSNFEGRGMLGFDIKKKKYFSTWVDNMATGIMMYEGTYDPAKKTLTFVGEDTNPKDGTKTKARDVLKIESDNRQVFEMYRTPATGKEFRVMQIIYTRAKSKN